jgi:hypothetical protein
MSSTLRHLGSMRVLAVVAVLALLVAACAGGSVSKNFDEVSSNLGGNDGAEAPRRTQAPATTAAPAAPGNDGEAITDASDELGSGGVQPVFQPTDFGRDIIYTAQLTVAVSDVAAAGAEATRVMSQFDAFLFGQDTEGLPEPRSVLIFKVAPEDFQAALAALGSIGEVRTQTVNADDVTERVVDLESQISTLETSVERLQEFLANATEIESIAQIEGQLVERETRLERLRGELRTLRDRVALATITLTITESFAQPSVRLLTSAYVGDDAGLSCPGSEELTIDEGEEVNLCFEVRNNGDTVLADFTLEDSVLELVLGDLTVVDGDPAEPLQPGQAFLLTTTLEPDRRVRTQTTVTAVPVNEDGTPIEARKLSTTGAVTVRVDEPEGMPGFDDGLRVATNVLEWIGGVIVIVAGLAVPFLWVIPLAALWWWWRRRRRRAGTEGPPPPSPVDPDTPPAASNAAASATPE